MKLSLERRDDDGTIVTFSARRVLAPGSYELRYPTRTGALLLIDGIVRGAFDRQHEAIEVGLDDGASEIEIRVERHSLPTSGLPAGDGLRWRAMLANAEREPARDLHVGDALRPICGKGAQLVAAAREARAIEFIGHAHLDVAWLWTYEEARRKAARTFATAARQLSRDRAFVFTQSQPQLYAWVEADEPTLFAQIGEHAREGRFDASGAALWVESDCNVPSGESLLRQLVYGKRYIIEKFGVEPLVAWLPDTFGFASTLPTLLRHAGVDAFATTKLMWNDTTRFPFERFWWRGADGSRVLAALFASYEGGLEPNRSATARKRREPLVVGYGDGGGGATDAMLRRARFEGVWTSLADWFARARREAVAVDAADATPLAKPLPEHKGELYLEYHRATLTTHRDIKARNAALERRLREIEELGAWARALHASPFFLDEYRKQIRAAWEIVLRAQFHDVITGTSIASVYADVHAEYDRAEELLANLDANVRSILPRTTLATNARGDALEEVAPQRDGREFLFENEYIVARVGEDGSIVALSLRGIPPASNAIVRANVLRAYRDKPKKWDAWNLDPGYEKRRVRVRFDGAEIEDRALEVRFAVGKNSLGVMRVSLRAGEAFLRVEIALAWNEAHALLRVENEFALRDACARFGAPHGTLERPLGDRSPAARAKFEFAGQRYARIDGTRASGAGETGVALFSLDGYGWNARTTRRDRVALGHSLVRGSRWPDPGADVGEHAFSLAYAPLEATSPIGELEALWQRFAGKPDVAMFSSADSSIAILATKLADDGDGVIVRARECDGEARDAAIICAARANAVVECDALERPLSHNSHGANQDSDNDIVTLADGALHARFAPYALRTFRVRLA